MYLYSILNFNLEMKYLYDLCPKFEIFTIMSIYNHMIQHNIILRPLFPLNSSAYPLSCVISTTGYFTAIKKFLLPVLSVNISQKKGSTRIYIWVKSLINIVKSIWESNF